MQLRRGDPHAFYQAEHTRGDLFELPPILHRQAEIRRQRRTRGEVPEAVREKKIKNLG